MSPLCGGRFRETPVGTGGIPRQAPVDAVGRLDAGRDLTVRPGRQPRFLSPLHTVHPPVAPGRHRRSCRPAASRLPAGGVRKAPGASPGRPRCCHREGTGVVRPSSRPGWIPLVNLTHRGIYPPLVCKCSTPVPGWELSFQFLPVAARVHPCACLVAPGGGLCIPPGIPRWLPGGCSSRLV